MKPKLELGFMRHDSLNKTKSKEIVDYAIKNNQAYFETCYFYLDNKCETFVYSLLKDYDREAYQICGKLPIHSIVEESGVEDIFLEQLKRVPGNYFDIYLLQALDETCDWILHKQKIIPYLLQQKQLGRIKRLGISIQCNHEDLERYLKLGCWDIVQMPLNYYDWFLCEGATLYSMVQKYNLPIIAQSPMKGGLLSKLPLENATSIAIDFLKQLNNVEIILTGCSSLETYTDTLLNLNKNSSYIDLSFWEDIIKKYYYNQKIRCINCNNCYKVCPERIPIRTLFKLYNKIIENPKQTAQYFMSYDILKKTIGEPCNICNHCGRCEQVCLQNLPIQKLLHDKIFELRT